MFLTTTQSHLFIDCVYFQNFSIHVHNFIFCSQHSWYHTLFCSAICPRPGGSGGGGGSFYVGILFLTAMVMP